MEWIACTPTNQYYIHKLRNCKDEPYLVTYETIKGKRYVTKVNIKNGRVQGKVNGEILAYMKLPKPYSGGIGSNDLSFFEYAVKQYNGDDSPEGDLVKDMLEDDFLKDVGVSYTKCEIKSYLEEMAAHPCAMDALESIWREYCRKSFDNVEARLFDISGKALDLVVSLMTLRDQMED